MNRKSLTSLLREIRRCEICAEHLPLGPRPVFTAGKDAVVLVIGQAPGRRVHETGVPWNDPSGDRLRDWLGVDRDTFYDTAKFALMPMGFCFPGTGRGGDLPPRPECAETWHDELLARMPRVKLTLLLGQYSLERYLGVKRSTKLASVVEAWRDYRPARLPLPHPSPRNNLWLRDHPWFEAEVVPYLRRRVRTLFSV